MTYAAHATIGIVSRNDPNGSAPTHAVAKLALVERQPGHSNADDATLAVEALAGKRWAQREIWYRFAPMVYGLLRRSLSTRRDHEDLVQEVFVRVFRRLHTLEKTTALRSFIYSVAVRVMSEEIRHFQVLQRTRSQLLLMAETSATAPVDYEARDTLLRIQHILDGMKDKHRAVFVLRHVEGMDLQEIADGLDLSLATVKRYLVKSLGAIQQAVVRDEGLLGKLGALSPANPSGGGP